MPPELGQCAPFRMEEVSRYDERGLGLVLEQHLHGRAYRHAFRRAGPLDLRQGPAATTPSTRSRRATSSRPAAVVDISRQSAANPDYELTVADVEAWEKQHGRIPPRNWVLLRTDWSKRSGRDYVNMREDGQHTPGPCPEAVRFLVEERDVHGLGTETIGTDAGQAFHFNPPYPAHYYMHGKGRYGLQCLTNLDLLPPTGSVILAAPLKIRRGSGSPCACWRWCRGALA